MPRTLVFSFDGTGNEPSDAGQFAEDESISNVLKLHILMSGGLKLDKTDTKTPSGAEQQTFYYNGIGTREGNLRVPLIGYLRRMANMAFAPRWADAAHILNEAKKDFDEAEVQKGDRIVVFGFSRGAALARKFVATILREDRNRKVAFLGVFDTVAAMDGIHRRGEQISSDVVFENGTLDSNVERAVHIVSLDENRVPFTPTLINRDDDYDSADCVDDRRILEVWFPGVHSDIGGGYWHDGLSDVALEFMIERCSKALAEDIRIEDGKNRDEVHALLDQQGLLQDQGEGLPVMEVDDFVIHPMANGVLHGHDGFMAKVGGQTPRMVCVNHNDRPDPKKLPLIHASAAERFHRVPGYRPAALRGLKFSLLELVGSNGEPKYRINTSRGISGLRNYVRTLLDGESGDDSTAS